MKQMRMDHSWMDVLPRPVSCFRITSLIRSFGEISSSVKNIVKTNLVLLSSTILNTLQNLCTMTTLETPKLLLLLTVVIDLLTKAAEPS